MITVTSRAALRSIANEAGRQYEFYDRRNCHELAQLWSEIGAEVYMALHQHADLLIRLEDVISNPPIIKSGEQHE